MPFFSEQVHSESVCTILYEVSGPGGGLWKKRAAAMTEMQFVLLAAIFRPDGML
jgi:hypothetical protein